MMCVYEWFARFRESRESVSDNRRSGRLAISVSDENIEKVRKLIPKDCQLTVRMIADEVQINCESFARTRVEQGTSPVVNVPVWGNDCPSAEPSRVDCRSPPKHKVVCSKMIAVAHELLYITKAFVQPEYPHVTEMGQKMWWMSNIVNSWECRVRKCS
ncbi:hypothetical protein TNCV_4589021 [Trichonephila clavipes]|nr:hypothetical protein TNCV_4589021 [Trichonephila clavipes]